MCGITGYVGNRNGLNIVASSLKNLEYRGYDSAGVAINDGGITVYKQAGEIDDLSLPLSTSTATTAIGHTRWSTHGKPTDANAHPHTDCTGEIAVVHNGIIDNYTTLKEELTDRHTFTSETDTEVIPHLLEDELRSGINLVEAVDRVTDILEGSYAFAVTNDDEDGIVAARQDSPLVIGHGENEHFLASDVPAFIDHTRKVTYLQDGDIAHLTTDSVTIYNAGEVVDREITTVDWDAEAAEKGGFDHYMAKEIHEQPKALRQAITGRIDTLNGTANLDIELPAEFLQSMNEIHIVAAGTSYHAALYTKELLESYTDIRVSTTVASEYEFKECRDPWQTLIIGISQSGETADTLTAIREANAAGAQTLAVTNTVGSSITRETDDTIYIRAGPEIGVAATKTFVSQVTTLGLFTVYLGRLRDELSSETATDILQSIRELPGAVQQVLDNERAIKRLAKKYMDSEAFFFIGRKFGYPVALESALKLKEISYDHAEGFPAGELKHGPLALITPDTAVIAILTEGCRPEKTVHNVKEVQSREGSVIGITNTANHRKFVDDELQVPDCGIMEPVLANVYLQLFAYHVADLKDRPIDKPRNLAKSVTVE